MNQTNEHADFAIDRSLDPRHFREAIDFSPPHWRVMIAAMAAIRHPTIIGHKQVFLEGKRMLVMSGTGLGRTYFKGIQS